MAKEIERKFHVTGEGWRAAAVSSAELRQAYILAGEDRSLRVRIIDGRNAKLTIKIGGGLLSRDEYEYDIPVADAEAMAENAVGIVLEKTRYRVPHGDHVWEIDVYAGAYAGLVVAEVEMRDESEHPALPGWTGAEITGDSRYANIVMATADPQVLRKAYGLPGDPQVAVT